MRPRDHHYRGHSPSPGPFSGLSTGLGERPSANHASPATLTPAVEKRARSLGLVRVAGNAFVCHSTKDFWKVRDGKLVRLTLQEVDNGETLGGAPRDNPADFLDRLLDDLVF